MTFAERLPSPVRRAARAGVGCIRALRHAVAAAIRARGPRVAGTDGIAVIDGLELLVPDPSQSALSRRLIELGVTERDFTDIARMVTRPGDVILDVGASIGYFSILFSKWAGPSGRVYAFEPWPSARTYLLVNLARNRLNNVVLDPRALADVDGQGHIAPPTYRLVLGPSLDHAAIEVSAARFDSVAMASGLDRLDVVKMDIEGAEGRALAGMTETFRRFRPILLLEVHPDMLPIHGHDVAGIHRFLEELGYEWLVVEPNADMKLGHHLVAGPRERLMAAGILSSEGRAIALAPALTDWSVAPGSPAEIAHVDRGLQVRSTHSRQPGYVVDGPTWWQQAPAAGRGVVRPSCPIWLTWAGLVPAGMTARAWLFEYAGRSLERRRSLLLTDGPMEWRFFTGPTTSALRLGIEVRGNGTLTVRRLFVEQPVT